MDASKITAEAEKVVSMARKLERYQDEVARLNQVIAEATQSLLDMRAGMELAETELADASDVLQYISAGEGLKSNLL